ncbi:putative ATP-dependent endonuclease of OLD family [Phyllobacterium trifolii]|uniref:Putative ATP-dependent endonuclease of OLD family n=1 Tax=Phyllobacterium trifolii TaxID=300193 RepID=A0A839U7Y5_9HYPH|nr:AAA family ATPase [Phyllobacterium trifolii]MBB3147236.1 putative ATP-dependent endonuclease of OLD family [Phyllobacterium trifolii]
MSFRGYYDEDEDDFVGETMFTRSLTEEEKPTPFRKKDKHLCGFLYLRTLRTGSRALSLEHGSLLDIILRLKELRGGMWEDTIDELKAVDVAADPALGVSGILESVNKALNKYVPKEWGAKPQLRVSNLTREHLRKVITAFMATGDGDHAAPFYRQGTGTINMLVLALLSQIAEDKQNVIFAMEEVETAIPPYAQKRIVHELRKLSAQSIVTTHSPYVLEEYAIEETVIVSRSKQGVMTQSTVELPDGVKLKRYRSEFRQRFCEGLLASRVLIAEGATEMSCFSAVARRLSELDAAKYSSLEAMGICVIDAGTDSQVAPFAKMYGDLGKRVFAACDKQTDEINATIEAQVEQLFMHDEHGIEDLVLKNTTPAALKRFSDSIEWPPHLIHKFGDPAAKPAEALSALFNWNKGGWSLPDFLAQCTEDEIPGFLRDACATLKELCLPEVKAEAEGEEGGVEADAA